MQQHPQKIPLPENKAVNDKLDTNYEVAGESERQSRQLSEMCVCKIS